MDIKKTIHELIKWGSQNAKNKKQAVLAASIVVDYVNKAYSDVTDDELIHLLEIDEGEGFLFLHKPEKVFDF